MLNNFEKEIKKKLENHEIPHSDQSWELFSSKLDQVNWNSLEDFDSLVKEKLNSVEVDFNPKHWNQLESHLDQAYFDEQLSKKVSSHQVWYNSEHWLLLKERLELEAIRKRRIWILKAAEAAILLLLLLSFFHIKPHKTILKQKVHASSLLDLKDSKTIATHTQSTQNLVNTQAEAAINNKKDVGQEVINIPTNSSALVTNNELSTVTKSSSILKEIESLIIPSLKLMEVKAFSIESILPSVPIKTKGSLDFIEDRAQAQMLEIEDKNWVSQKLSKNKLSLLEHERVPLIPTDIVSNNRKEKWISLYGALDLNVVERPLDLNFFEDPQKYGAFGTSYGVQYNAKNGSNEFETGIAYSVKDYDPNQLEYLYINTSTYERKFNYQKFNIIQIPLIYKRYLTQSKNWNLYAMAGPDLNFIMSTHYELENTLKNGSARPISQIEVRSKLSKKDFHDGLLQGGTVFENSYLTLTAAMGVERKFGALKIFFQPTYKHHFSSQKLGPNKERLSSLSLQIGTRYKI